MSYDVRTISNYILSNKDDISITEMMKILYFSYGWFLEMSNEELFHNKFEAWDYGIVIPELYFWNKTKSRVKHFTGFDIALPEKITILLDEIIKIYSNMEPFEISSLIKVSGSPWEIVMAWPQTNTMLRELIHAHFILKRKKSNV